MTKAILFDFTQTLADSSAGFRLAEKDAQTKICKNLGLTVWSEFMEHYRRIRKDFHSQSQTSRPAMWQEVYGYYCRDCDDKLLAKWDAEYWDIVDSRTALFRETLEVLQQLSGEYRLGLISNVQGTGQHTLDSFPGLRELFEIVILAGQGDVPAKPDPMPFNVCLEALDVSAGDAIHVGDDWRMDVCGAQAVGIRPVWLQHSSVDRSWPSERADVPIIHDLRALLTLDGSK